jgi:hypothetical protein
MLEMQLLERRWGEACEFLSPGNIYENQEKMREIQSAEWGGGRGQGRSCEGLVHISHPCHAIDGGVRGGGGGEQTVQAIGSSRLAVSV